MLKVFLNVFNWNIFTFISSALLLKTLWLLTGQRGKLWKNLFSSVQFSCSFMSDSLQDARPPCPSTTPRIYPSSCPLSRCCHTTISSSVVLFSCHQFFPASGSFQMSQLLTSGGQSIRVSASISVFPKNTQNWFPLGCLHSCKHMWPLTGLMLFKNSLLLKKICKNI